MDESQLKQKAVFGIAIPPIIMGLILFVSAGTVSYWEAWIFLATYTMLVTAISIYFIRTNPALLERRMQFHEPRISQKIIMSMVWLSFVGLFAVSGLDRRFGWSHLPFLAVLAGDAVLVMAFYLYFLVFKENSFASSTIRITEGQTVISTGVYGVVRHPMYTGGVLFLTSVPIALGSTWALLALIPALPALIWRIVDEERMLNESLPGYTEYCTKVKYRLIPGVY